MALSRRLRAWWRTRQLASAAELPKNRGQHDVYLQIAEHGFILLHWAQLSPRCWDAELAAMS